MQRELISPECAGHEGATPGRAGGREFLYVWTLNTSYPNLKWCHSNTTMTSTSQDQRQPTRWPPSLTSQPLRVPGAPLPPTSASSRKLQTWVLQETHPHRVENESEACRLSTRVSNERPSRCYGSADPGLGNSTPGPQEPGSGLSQNWTPVSICSCVRLP